MNALHMLLKGKKRGKSYKIYNPMHLGNECTQQILLARKGANSHFSTKFPWEQFKALSCMLGMPIGDNGQP